MLALAPYSDRKDKPEQINAPMKMTFTQRSYAQNVGNWATVFSIFTLLIFGKGAAQAQCDPRTSCIAQVNVTLDDNCKLAITPKMVGLGDCIGTYRVIVADGNQLNGNVVDCPGLFDYAVFNGANQQVCWGKLLAEDKTGPKLVSTDFFKGTLLCSDVNFVLNNAKTIGKTSTNDSYSQLISGSLLDSDVKNLGIPNFVDNCKDCGCNITLKYSDRVVYPSCAEAASTGIFAKIFRTFVATDCRGMSTSVEQVINFRRPAISDFTFRFGGDAIHKSIIIYNACGTDKSVIKREDVVPFVTNFWGKKVYLDEIECQYSYKATDTEFPICGNSSIKIDRRIQIFDWCTNKEVASIPILIKIGDFTGPTIRKPANIPVLSTGASNCAATLPTSAAGIKAALGVDISDNCGGTLISVTVRTKGLFRNGILVEPNGWYSVNYPVMNGVIQNLPPTTHRLIISANDNCKNSLKDSFEFKVVDKIAPVMKCDDDLRVSLSNTPGFQTGYGKVEAKDVDEGSWDNCQLKWIRVRREVPKECESNFLTAGYDLNGDKVLNEDDGFETVNGKKMTPLADFIEVFCCDLAKPVSVELWGEDYSGNRNYCWTGIQVEDKTEPTCDAPDDITISCFDKSLGTLPDRVASGKAYGDVTITGGNDCANPNIQYSFVDNSKCGKGTIKRIWTISRQTTKGTVNTTCEQLITVTPVRQFDICFPRDTNANCKTLAADSIKTFNLGCDVLAVNVTDKRYESSDNECYKIYRTYTVINWCEFTDKCGDPMLQPIVIDRKFGDFGKKPIYVLVRDNSRYAISKDRIFNNADDVINSIPKCTQFDAYRHVFQYTQILKVYDSERPKITFTAPSPFAARANDCLADIGIAFQATDNCSAKIELETTQLVIDPFRANRESAYIRFSSPRWSVQSNSSGAFTISVKDLPQGKHDLIVVVRDGCGELSVPTRIPFEVKDQKAPAPICINGLSSALMPVQGGDPAVTVWANDFVASPIFDCNGQGEANAQGLKRITKYSVNRVGATPNVSQTSIVLDCKDKDKQVQVELHAWDELGNHDFCRTFISVTDNQKICPANVGGGDINITGYVATAKNQMMKGVSVKLTGGATMDNSSGQDGTFSFNKLTTGKDYTVTPDMNKDFLEGVNTLDMIVLNRHLLNTVPITNPYQLIASDVDGSKSITIADLVKIRSLILGVNPDFGVGTKSWRFVDQAYKFPQPLTPWSPDFPETVGMAKLDHSEKANFTGVKVGDINQSISIGLDAPEIRSEGEALKLSFRNIELEPGLRYEIPVMATNLAKFGGFQFALDYNQAALEMLEIKPALAGVDNYSHFKKEGSITALWLEDLKPYTSNTPGKLFTLVFRAKQNGKLSQLLNLNPRLLKPEAYDRRDRSGPVNMEFSSNPIQTPHLFKLEQNVPNPFNNETIVGFWLPTGNETVIELHDITGRLVRRIDDKFAAGYNQLTINRSDLPASGIYFLTLRQGDKVATQKLVLTN